MGLLSPQWGLGSQYVLYFMKSANNDFLYYMAGTVLGIEDIRSPWLHGPLYSNGERQLNECIV